MSSGKSVAACNLAEPDYRELYHQLMEALCQSQWKHGDCKSGKRYGGVPKACAACMAKIKLDEMIGAYKGRTVGLC